MISFLIVPFVVPFPTNKTLITPKTSFHCKAWLFSRLCAIVSKFGARAIGLLSGYAGRILRVARGKLAGYWDRGAKARRGFKVRKHLFCFDLDFRSGTDCSTLLVRRFFNCLDLITGDLGLECSLFLFLGTRRFVVIWFVGV